MDEIELKDFFIVAWKKKIQILLIIFVCLIIGGVYSYYCIKPMYTSSTTILIDSIDSKSQATNDSITLINGSNSKLITTCTELVKSKVILNQVISNLNINMKAEELSNNIKASAVNNSEIINIEVNNTNPKDAEKIANEIAKVFENKVKQIYKIDNVQIIDKAEVSNSPYNINHKKDILVSFAIGIVIALSYVLFIALFNENGDLLKRIKETIKAANSK